MIIFITSGILCIIFLVNLIGIMTIDQNAPISPFVKYCGIFACIILYILIYLCYARAKHSKKYFEYMRPQMKAVQIILGVFAIYLFIELITLAVNGLSISTQYVIAYQNIILAVICVPMYLLFSRYYPKSI